MRIIVVEDEPALRAVFTDELRQEGFNVTAVGNALEFYRAMAESGHDIAIIDISLPDESGLSLASWLNQKGGTGIILLTGNSSAESRFEGFKAGADLYFAKPVQSSELVQAILNLGRRLMTGERPAPQRSEPKWFFDPVNWRLAAPGGFEVKLSSAEVKLMQRLIERPAAMISRHELREALGYTHDKMGDQCLDGVVRRLRRKITGTTGESGPIQTVHGQGYIFSAPLHLDRRSLQSS